MILSIIYFFVLVIGLGFLVDIIVKKWSVDPLEKLVIRIGFGTLLISIWGVIINQLKIQLHWLIFLGVAIITFAVATYLRKKEFLNDIRSVTTFLRAPKIKKHHIYTVLLLIIFSITAYMYIKGSFAYPWLENGDPYGYASSSKYVALHKTFTSDYYFDHYSYPYTQGYQIFMGVIHQTNDSIYETLKLFNALIISLSILFFFYFVRRATNNSSQAFWSALILAAVPAWLSHFIFSLNFNMSLMIVLFYALFSIDNNKKWKYVAGLCFGALLINHFYTSFVLTLILITLYAIRVLAYKEFNKEYIHVILLGVLVSLIYWIPAFIKNWQLMTLEGGGPQLGGLSTFIPIIQNITNSSASMVITFIVVILLVAIYATNKYWFKSIKILLSKKYASHAVYITCLIAILAVLLQPTKIKYIKGTASRVYTFADFFVAQKTNMINNPIGIGIVAMTLVILGTLIILLHFKILFQKKHFYYLSAITILIFTYLGVKGASLSIGFVPFRMWTFFGFAAAIVGGIGACNLVNFVKKLPLNKITKMLISFILVVVIVTLLYTTSFSQKYYHNTAIWPEHQLMSPDSQQLLIWMREGGIPKDSMVLPLCNKPSMVFGYDMNSVPWTSRDLSEKPYMPDDPAPFYKISLDQTMEENYDFLKKHNFEYTVLGVDCVAKIQANGTLLDKRAQEMMNSSKFSVVQNTATEILFRVH